MAIEKLHEKIRSMKNPAMVDFGIQMTSIPRHILDAEGDTLSAYTRFCRELMEGLKDSVPSVRFSFDLFALLGADGLNRLSELLKYAADLGYYSVLEGPQILSPWGADRAAEGIFGGDAYPCDALLVSPYIGSDAIKPFLPYVREEKKDLFLIVRSPNKSALELQDLYTGSRLAHMSTAEIVNRMGEGLYEKCGYSRVGASVSAGAPATLRNLRSGCNRMFLLVDGLDYPSGNFKNSSLAFDQFGYGAVLCAGPSVTAAWQEAESDGTDFVEHAVKAAENIKRNISRYITIL